MTTNSHDKKSPPVPRIELTESDKILLCQKGYTFLSQLGEGLYAKVYYGLFVKSSSEDQFACKVINMRKAPKEFVSKFLPRELDILSKLCHPHIIHVNSIIQRNTKYLIFMRFAEKGDLLEYILANGEIDEHQCRLWFRQLALAIEYLHAVDISHRDIKCENILITNNMNIKLTDFGFARFTVDANRRPVTSNTYCGSFAYAPPEILMGRPYQPKPTDIWSMGVVLYVMLNKCMPFPNTNIKQLVKEQTKRAWTFRSKVQEVVSDEVRLLTARAIEPDVRKRVTIQQVLEDPWFDLEVGLKIKDRREQDALEVGIRLKDKIIPVGKRSKITTSRTKQITLLREEISDFTHNRHLWEADSRVQVSNPRQQGKNERKRVSNDSDVVREVKKSSATTTNGYTASQGRLNQAREEESINLLQAEPSPLLKVPRAEHIND